MLTCGLAKIESLNYARSMLVWGNFRDESTHVQNCGADFTTVC